MKPNRDELNGGRRVGIRYSLQLFLPLLFMILGWAGCKQDAMAGAENIGDGLAVIPTAEGAQLRCVIHRLEGEATCEGLWLTSTVANAANDRFRLVATEVGHVTLGAPPELGGTQTSDIQNPTSNIQLSVMGDVSIDAERVRFRRPRLVEEYTVSRDGVRQDFVVMERPAGAGELAVRLAVSGAKVEAAAFGVRLVLGNSGRKIAYSQLRVTDATGKELTARMEVASGILPDVEGVHRAARDLAADFLTAWLQDTSESAGLEAPALRQAGMPAATALAVMVNDADAVYPVRIDPTFSDANWFGMGGFGGANGPVSAAVVDGSGNLYIGGDFTVVGGVAASYIAKWDGRSWSALGSGMSYPFPGGAVIALAVSGSDLYAGGRFTMAGGSAATNIAKWNGNSWSALGSGINAGVGALAVSGSDVYAGGIFWTAGGSMASYIAKWNGSSWTALGSGMNNVVSALVVSGRDLYAGGLFTTAGGNAANHIAKWNGSSWSALGSGMNSAVYALAVSGSDVYAGGDFTMADGGPSHRIAKWNGSSWSALGSGMDNVVSALAVSGSNLYAGGYFMTAGSSVAIAKWDGSSWSGLGSGMDNVVYALALSGADVYAGGRFTMAGGSMASYIAKWNGSSWAALGSGMNGYVNALAVSGSDVYAGGYFTTAGGNAANHIAKWNGSSWSPLGSGMNGNVNALAVLGRDVYAGGAFTNAGGSAANRIAKWDGTSWTALGRGLNSGQFYAAVHALAVLRTNLYAGGDFIMAGDTPVNNIARWTGSSWRALGWGMDNVVSALAVSGTNLYAGGDFESADEVRVSGIAKWDGDYWTSLGLGINSGVYALAASGSDLYVGGMFFATAGGSFAIGIAKCNGSSWSALGSGMNGSVVALAMSGSELYVGGDFTTAGGKLSTYIARAELPTLTPPTLSVLRSGTDVVVSWPSADTDGFALEQAGTLAAPVNWVANAATVTDDGTAKSVSLPATNSLQLFRLRRP